MATDEGVLSRTLGMSFMRDGNGRLPDAAAAKLYTIHRYENGQTRMHLVFRDHALSDLIGFVYSGMPAAEAAAHLIRNIKESAQPILKAGSDAVVSIILDGENAWEYYPESGREFLRRLYDALQKDPGIEAVTVSEAIERHRNSNHLGSIAPGSWIHANFNVWIGAPEDNRSWDYLSYARKFYAQAAPNASEEHRTLALEELFIAEGSDWNWWYGPEHHSANDREFDELYRKHLSNVYNALGEPPPDYLARSIIHADEAKAHTVPQTSYIHPRIDGDDLRYFDWIGAATVTADGRDSAMHGKQFLMKTLYSGIDEKNLYAKVELALSAEELLLVMNFESWWPEAQAPELCAKLEVKITGQSIADWSMWLSKPGEVSEVPAPKESELSPELRVKKVFEVSVPLALLRAELGGKVRLRAGVWRGGLPIDSIPAEGWMEVAIVPEQELMAMAPW